ncbi:MAG: hypothetical protein IJY27_02870 [Clostridia bacterium]|nr:hypothetical protein [Clostridia bacterium]
MIEILPIQSKSEQEALCARCGVKYNETAMAYSAQTEGEMTGICQFSIAKNGGYVHDIGRVPGHEDFETVFLLGRAALNFIDLCGVHYAIYDGELFDESAIRAIGFSKNSDGKYDVDLTDFFTNPCQHHKD